MQKRSSRSNWNLPVALAVALGLAGCGSDPVADGGVDVPMSTDTGGETDASTDLGAAMDVPAAVDVGADVPQTPDVPKTPDVPTATDVETTDVPDDVPALTDVPADVPADVPTDVPADVPTVTDAPTGDASVDAVVVTGRVTHEMRAISAAGLGPVTAVPTVGVSVELVAAAGGAARSARVVTNADGRFTLIGTGAAGEMVSVRVIASRDDAVYRLSIQNLGTATYASTTAAFAAGPAVTRDVAITEATNSGAFAIFMTLCRGLDFVRATLPTPPPALPVHWERGTVTPGGTSYLSGGEIFILGGPMDADEYDVPVLLHEFGHFVERTYSHSDSPGGDHDGSPTDPRLAWGEGFGTWFGCAANDSPVYLDSTIDGMITLSRDLSALPLERNYLGVATEPLTQNIGEYLVGGSMWAITNAGTSRSAQVARQLGVLLRYFSRTPIPNRGVAGVDFVDFLDGYECVNGTADREAIRAYVVTTRLFPYDFAGSAVCP